MFLKQTTYPKNEGWYIVHYDECVDTGTHRIALYKTMILLGLNKFQHIFENLDKVSHGSIMAMLLHCPCWMFSKECCKRKKDYSNSHQSFLPNDFVSIYKYIQKEVKSCHK